MPIFHVFFLKFSLSHERNSLLKKLNDYSKFTHHELHITSASTDPLFSRVFPPAINLCSSGTVCYPIEFNDSTVPQNSAVSTRFYSAIKFSVIALNFLARLPFRGESHVLRMSKPEIYPKNTAWETRRVGMNTFGLQNLPLYPLENKFERYQICPRYLNLTLRCCCR